MTITCTTVKEFLEVIEGLVSRGLGFEADGHHFIIRLTGAH